MGMPRHTWNQYRVAQIGRSGATLVNGAFYDWSCRSDERILEEAVSHFLVR